LGPDYWASLGAIERHIHIVDDVKLEDEKQVREYLQGNVFDYNKYRLSTNFPQWQLWIVNSVLKNQYMVIFQYHDWWFTPIIAHECIWKKVLPEYYKDDNTDQTKVPTYSTIDFVAKTNYIPVWLDIAATIELKNMAIQLVRGICEYEKSYSSKTVQVNDKVIEIDPYQVIDASDMKKSPTICLVWEPENTTLPRLNFSHVQREDCGNILIVRAQKYNSEITRITMLLDPAVFLNVKRLLKIMESKFFNV
jgi:hypothetical protein